ncbi:uncharacterized protein si:ch73-248e21.5 [Polyodon spathula]|uniref:uncharacterized protein si:ch73-248e21.5 n=1 Tax=Polyodon spathula TaxID=7913 RepID=UPI001B7E300D|nr:uncharacterized protein si:ch73-248e21.5 [Polyodon spathula]
MPHSARPREKRESLNSTRITRVMAKGAILLLFFLCVSNCEDRTASSGQGSTERGGVSREGAPGLGSSAPPPSSPGAPLSETRRDRITCLAALAALGLLISVFASATVFLCARLQVLRAGSADVSAGFWAKPKCSSGNPTHPKKKECSLWLQPKVTVEEITEFWYSNGVELKEIHCQI